MKTIFWSPDLDTCRWKRCHFYSKCVKGKEAKCECNRVPSNVDSPVCGSDGKTYNNLVALQLAACQEQKWIVPRHRGRCATGKPPLILFTENKLLPQFLPNALDEEHFSKHITTT